jgi:hypothetical protein
MSLADRYGLYELQMGPLPWRHLADLAGRVTRPGFVFGDIHAALAYASTGDTAAMSALIAGLEAWMPRGTRSPAPWSCRSSVARRPTQPETTPGRSVTWSPWTAARLLRRRVALRPSPSDLAWMSRVPAQP